MATAKHINFSPVEENLIQFRESYPAEEAGQNLFNLFEMAHNSQQYGELDDISRANHFTFFKDLFNLLNTLNDERNLSGQGTLPSKAV